MAYLDIVRPALRLRTPDRSERDDRPQHLYGRLAVICMGRLAVVCMAVPRSVVGGRDPPLPPTAHRSKEGDHPLPSIPQKRRETERVLRNNGSKTALLGLLIRRDSVWEIGSDLYGRLAVVCMGYWQWFVRGGWQ